jgi:hypothetical protein
MSENLPVCDATHQDVNVKDRDSSIKWLPLDLQRTDDKTKRWVCVSQY